MMLAGWGAWRFSRLATPPPISRPTHRIDREFRQLHLQSIASLDSSVNLLRQALTAQESETVLLNLTEQVRQQTQAVSLLSLSDPSFTEANPTDTRTALLDQCLEFRQLLLRKSPTPALSQHLAVFQSEVRHLHYRVAGN
ncbi:hypothetical protein GCM10028803_17230 [Larkinella knui]